MRSFPQKRIIFMSERYVQNSSYVDYVAINDFKSMFQTIEKRALNEDINRYEIVGVEGKRKAIATTSKRTPDEAFITAFREMVSDGVIKLDYQQLELKFLQIENEKLKEKLGIQLVQ